MKVVTIPESQQENIKALVWDLIQFCHENEGHQEIINYELCNYLVNIIVKDRILIEWDARGIAGFMEYFRLDETQFGRIVLGDVFNIIEEDITEGPIAYMANVCVRHDLRGAETFKKLQRRFFSENADARYITGTKNGKRYKPIAVFKRR